MAINENDPINYLKQHIKTLPKMRQIIIHEININNENFFKSSLHLFIRKHQIPEETLHKLGQINCEKSS